MREKTPNLPSTVAAALRKEAPSYVEMGEGGDCATIASYNVHKCVGTDGRFDPGRTAKVIAELNADIVALQEADQRFGERVGLLDLEALAEATDLVPVHYSTNARSHGWHGNIILARRSKAHDVHALRLPGLEPRGALIVDLEFEDTPLRIIASHLGLWRRSRSLQAKVLLAATTGVKRPTILLGDLNEWRVRTRSSLLELMPQFGPLHAVLPSFPSGFPLLALDRILARPPGIIASLEVHQSPLARVASDHLPIKARLNLKTARQIESKLNVA
ncbi:endonuclease/exonuclease/phosphatase family protein [Escherichia coli]|nr:endonuclease/exonuclease/phosphatase family protein [Escherichia coli]